MNFLIPAIIFSTFCLSSFGQSVLRSEEAPEFKNQQEPVEERVEKISPSSRIFIISNDNAAVGPGDFITLLVDDKMTARAIVAKSQSNKAGIKIIKIYSLEKWKSLKRFSKVKIIRGDDSYYAKLQDKSKEEGAKILDDDQLFDESNMINDELDDLNDNKKRHIKTDNIIGIGYGSIESLNPDGGDERYAHYSARWMHQFLDNIWGEIHIGQSVLSDYPYVENEPNNSGLNTVLTNLTFKLKYTITAPYYSFVMPYVGFQILRASNDEAGQNTSNEGSAQIELDQVDALEENTIVFGVGILKRLVPGWFITAELGTDIINFGIALEF